MNKFTLLACVTLVGCSLSQEKFEADSIDLSCTKIMECTPEAAQFLGFDDQESCVELLTENASESDTSTCTYDAEKAQACLDELESATCEDYAAGSADTSCEEALTNCGESSSEESTEETAE